MQPISASISRFFIHPSPLQVAPPAAVPIQFYEDVPQEEVCGICIEHNLAINQDRPILLGREQWMGHNAPGGASHRFHASCLNTWLERQSSCPSCRMLLIDEAPGGQLIDEAPPSLSLKEKIVVVFLKIRQFLVEEGLASLKFYGGCLVCHTVMTAIMYPSFYLPIFLSLGFGAVPTGAAVGQVMHLLVMTGLPIFVGCVVRVTVLFLLKRLADRCIPNYNWTWQAKTVGYIALFILGTIGSTYLLSQTPFSHFLEELNSLYTPPPDVLENILKQYSSTLHAFHFIQQQVSAIFGSLYAGAGFFCLSVFPNRES